MKILISFPQTNGRFRYRIEFQGLLLWHGKSLYKKRQDAVSDALLDAWSTLIEFDFFNPAALFDLKSGLILATNHAHRRWLGHDSVGQHHSRFVGNHQTTSRIIAAGTKPLGLYEIRSKKERSPLPTRNAIALLSSHPQY